MEEWKTVKGFNNVIEVSNLGNVRRKFKHKYAYYKGNINDDGYLRINISINRERINKFVHVLVLETFTEKVPGLEFVNHINGDKLDNRLENLEWCNPSQNMQHAYDNDLKRTDKKHSRAKLTEDDVLFIYSSDLSIKELCKKYNMNKSAICRIRSSKTWRWLTQRD